MRAAVVRGLGELKIETAPDPVCGPGDVILEVAAALTCGTDAKALTRGHPSFGEPPFVLGHEFAGRIVETGPQVSGFASGELVMGANSVPCETCFFCRRGQRSLCEHLEFVLGAYATQIRVPAAAVRRNLYRLGGLSPDLAAMAEPLACAIKAVDAVPDPAGQEIAVIGAGQLGIMLIGTLVARGAHVIAVDPHGHRLEMAERFGARQGLIATRGAEDGRRIRRLANGGRGPDRVFEAVGRLSSWKIALDAVRDGGTVHFFGGCSHGDELPVPTFRIHYREVSLVGSFHHEPRYIAAALDELRSASRPWPALIGGEISLEELEDALLGRSHQDAFKLAVRPS